VIRARAVSLGPTPPKIKARIEKIDHAVQYVFSLSQQQNPKTSPDQDGGLKASQKISRLSRNACETFAHLYFAQKTLSLTISGSSVNLLQD
jgi:hypothetical protein